MSLRRTDDEVFALAYKSEGSDPVHHRTPSIPIGQGFGYSLRPAGFSLITRVWPEETAVDPFLQSQTVEDVSFPLRVRSIYPSYINAKAVSRKSGSALFALVIGCFEHVFRRSQVKPGIQ